MLNPVCSYKTPPNLVRRDVAPITSPRNQRISPRGASCESRLPSVRDAIALLGQHRLGTRLLLGLTSPMLCFDVCRALSLKQGGPVCTSRDDVDLKMVGGRSNSRRLAAT